MAKDLQLIDGDLPSRPQLIFGVELIAQRIRVRLQTHRGEWLLNRSVGLPYLRWRGQNPPRVQSISSRVRETVQTTPDEIDVRDFCVLFYLRAELEVFAARLMVDGRFSQGDRL